MKSKRKVTPEEIASRSYIAARLRADDAAFELDRLRGLERDRLNDLLSVAIKSKTWRP